MTSPKSHAARLVLLLALTLGITAVAGVSVMRRVETFQPVGFSVARAGGAPQVLDVRDPSIGLQAGDRVLLIDGREVVDPRADLRGRAESTVTVQRGDELLQVSYQRPPLDLDLSYLILTLIGTVYLGIGLFVLFRQGGRPARLFHLWCLASATFFLFSPAFLISGEPPADGWDKLIYLGDELARIWLAPLTLHLFLVFPARPNGTKPGRRLPFVYLPAAVLTTLQADLTLFNGRFVFGGVDPPAIQSLGRLELIHLVVLSLVAAAIVLLRLRNKNDFEEHRQVQWIAAGVGGAYVPFALLYLGPHLLGLGTPEVVESLAVLPLAVAPLAFSYAILRYKLWDLSVIVRDTISSTLTLFLGIVSFSLVHLAISRGLPQDLSLARNMLSFLAGLTIAGLLVPARRGIASTLERFQYRGNFGKRRALAEFADDLLHERDLQTLCRRLADELEDSVPLAQVNLYLTQGARLTPVRAEEELPPELGPEDLGEQVWQTPVKSLRGLTVPGTTPEPQDLLFQAGYRYVFPLTVLDHRVGLVITGYRPEDTPLNSDDVELVRHLLDQAALAIENAQLLDQLHHQLDEVVRLQEYSAGIIESSPAGIAVLDPNDRIVSANAAFATLVGRHDTPDRLAGFRVEELLPIRPLPRPGQGLVEASYCDPGGEEHYYQISVSSFSREGAPLRVLIVQDVSEKKAMENALKEQDRLAALGMLAAGVAHEVNTPITGISSYAQMLLADTPEDDPRHDLLEKVEKQTFRAARIVNNLLEFARNKTGEQKVFDVVPLVSETLDLLHERMNRRNVRIVWDPPDRSVRVLATEGELQQVLTNLAVNASDAMAGRGGTLTVHVTSAEGRMRLSVEDTGVGIPPERLERIFQPFFSTKLGSGGTGLGLSISYEIIRKYGGDLRAQSRPGRGSVFVVELPMAQEVDASE